MKSVRPVSCLVVPVGANANSFCRFRPLGSDDDERTFQGVGSGSF